MPEDECAIWRHVPCVDGSPILVVVVERWRSAYALRERHREFTCQGTASQQSLQRRNREHTRRVRYPKDDLGDREPAQLAVVKLLDDRIGVFNQAVV